MESKKKKGKIDRTNAKYSETDFLKMQRSQQLQLARKYQMSPVANYDDGTFTFSYSHFAVLCDRLGFAKSVIDTQADGIKDGTTILIDRGRRAETIIKKITLDINTINKISQLIGDLSNIEQSKIIDVILSQACDKLLADKAAGKLEISYRATDKTRLV